ncbi:MAG: hypothetical protein CMB16_06625 [Euryarchaeota archaeon]|nr:hypothetical protein [Euryarchaeota archaeon]
MTNLNLGLLDRAIRFLTGLGVVLFDYVSSANWEIIFLIFGIWSVTTSVFGWCPFYRLFGVNTCPASFAIKQNNSSTD